MSVPAPAAPAATEETPTTAVGGETTTTPAPAATPAPATTAPLNLAGYTYSQEGVARFLSRLAVIPELQGVKLVKSVQAPVSGRIVVQFSIQADVRRQAAA